MTLFLLGILISIPVAIFSNLLTPRVKIWFTTRNSNHLERRRIRLERELEYIRLHHGASPSESAAFAAYRVLNSVMDFALAIIANAFYLTAYARFIKTDPAFSGGLAIISVAAFFLAIYRVSNTRRLLRNIYHFDEYATQAKSELDRLDSLIRKPRSDTQD